MRAHAVESGGRHRAFVVCEHVLHQAMVGEALSDKIFLVGRGGNERTPAVDQYHRSSRTLGDGRCQFADPLQIDDGKNHPGDGAVIPDGGKNGDQVGRLPSLG